MKKAPQGYVVGVAGEAAVDFSGVSVTLVDDDNTSFDFKAFVGDAC